MKFSGERRPRIRKLCACGCGEYFDTTFPNKTTKDEAHRKRLSRAKSRNVRG